MLGDPAESVGVVVDPIDDERNRLFGVCFALGDERHWITADHVVEGGFERGADTLHVLVVDRLMPAPVVAVFRHPTLDVAVLRIDAHDADVEVFSHYADAAVGEVVSLVNPKTRRVVSTSVTGLWRMNHTSTAVSRATVPVPAGARELNYRYAAYSVHADASVGHGFSGSPVWDVEGSLVGLYCARNRETDTGLVLQISTAMPWLDATIFQQREECAA